MSEHALEKEETAPLGPNPDEFAIVIPPIMAGDGPAFGVVTLGFNRAFILQKPGAPSPVSCTTSACSKWSFDQR